MTGSHTIDSQLHKTFTVVKHHSVESKSLNELGSQSNGSADTRITVYRGDALEVAVDATVQPSWQPRLRAGRAGGCAWTDVRSIRSFTTIAFIGVALTAGRHVVVVFLYLPDGVLLGAAITVITLWLVASWPRLYPFRAPGD